MINRYIEALPCIPTQTEGLGSTLKKTVFFGNNSCSVSCTYKYF